MKVCRQCGIEKNHDEFSKSSRSKDGLWRYCKPCWVAKVTASRVKHPKAETRRRERYNERRRNARLTPEGQLAARERHLKRHYGLTLEDYDRMLADQDGGCAICDLAPEHSRYGVLVVDHVHESDPPVVRGLLCNSCNRLLGMADDDPNILIAMADYLL